MNRCVLVFGHQYLVAENPARGDTALEHFVNLEFDDVASPIQWLDLLDPGDALAVGIVSIVAPPVHHTGRWPANDADR